MFMAETGTYANTTSTDIARIQEAANENWTSANGHQSQRTLPATGNANELVSGEKGLSNQTARNLVNDSDSNLAGGNVPATNQMENGPPTRVETEFQR